MRVGTDRRCRRWRQAATPNQILQPTRATKAIANSRVSGMCSKPLRKDGIGRLAPQSSAAGEQLLQRLLEVRDVVDDRQRDLVVLGDPGEQSVGVAVLADDQPLRAGCGQLDELVG